MLLIEPQLQRPDPIFVQRPQIVIVICPTVQHPSLVIHGGINQPVGFPAIFRLHVEGHLSHFHVRVVPENHRPIHFPPAVPYPTTLAQRRDAARMTFHSMKFHSVATNLTARRLTRYYTLLTMTPSGVQAYFPLLIHLLIAAGLAGALILVSTFIGWRRPNKAKMQPYECGVTPTGDAREPFSVKFYLVAMVFILFDVEAIFLYPWAFIFKDLASHANTRVFGFLEMMFYVAILLVGYIYLWKKGALDWHKSQKER
jgi:NADH-quinone oxidoreductase subunit A